MMGFHTATYRIDGPVWLGEAAGSQAGKMPPSRSAAQAGKKLCSMSWESPKSARVEAGLLELVQGRPPRADGQCYWW
jgi:hypothetical protein